MTKAELEKEMKRYTQGSPLITRVGVKKCMGISSEKAGRIVEGLPRMGGPRSGFYIGDVAERMMEMRR